MIYYTMNWNQVIKRSEQYKGDIYGIDSELTSLFSKALNYKMKEHNVTQLSIAKALNKTPATVNHWAKGRTCPPLKTIIKIKEYFDKL